MIVYIDISDIQAKAIFYRFDAAGRVQEGNFDPACRSPELVFWSTPWWARWSYTIELFYTRHLLHSMSRETRATSDPLLTDLARPTDEIGPGPVGRMIQSPRVTKRWASKAASPKRLPR